MPTFRAKFRAISVKISPDYTPKVKANRKSCADSHEKLLANTKSYADSYEKLLANTKILLSYALFSLGKRVTNTKFYAD